MRIVFWARAQVGIPLATVLRMNGLTPGLLVGGMMPCDVQAMIERFDADENGILICTAAHECGWRVSKPAAVFELSDSFCDMRQASSRVLEPDFPPPTSEDFLEWYFGRGNYASRDIREITWLRQHDTQPALPAPEKPKPRRRKKERTL